MLVAGLLLIGDAAARDGVFEAAGARLERIPIGGAGLLTACLALVAWSAPGQLVDDAGRFETAGVAAAASILVNNLPAAVLLSAGHLPHPRALLLGLALGPNLAVTGSLSAYLWWQAARGAGARPSIRAYSRHGILLAPVAILAALAVAAAVSAPQ